MPIVTSGALSLGTTAGTNRSISAEYGGGNPIQLSFYYAGSSYGYVPAGTEDENGNLVPAVGALKFSDFYGTPADTSIHSSAFTNAVLINQYFSKSGYDRNGGGTAFGSIVDDTVSGTFQGSTNVIIESVYNSAGITLELTVSSGSKTFNNSGFTSIRFYLNQSNNSGTPDLTLLRTGANFSANNSIGAWFWTGSFAVADYFGTSAGNTHFFEIL